MRYCSERELLNRLAAADNGAARELTRRYTRTISAIAASHGLPGTERDDLIQAVWEALLRSGDRIREPEALSGWIRTTAHRLSIRQVRGSRRELCADLSVLPIADEYPGPEQLAISAERVRLLGSALARLPERCRRLLELDQNQAPYRHIGAVLALAEGSIGPSRRRCLERLRAGLAERLGEPD